MNPLDHVAESYVRLTLSLGEIDPFHVDAYFGPPEWKQEAKGQSLPEIAERAAQLREGLNSEPQLIARAKFLDKQLGALETRAKLLNGVAYTFDEESAAVYDVTAPRRPDSFYAAVVSKLEHLLPGHGMLAERWEAFRSQFYIPPDKLAEVFAAGIEIARDNTKAFISLPKSESFEIELVSGQVWGAYNWYKGHAHSLIQVNTDLPMMIDRIIPLACHEGYPGHHVYNTLLERNMVEEHNWLEFTIYPLYSPESLIAEGTAEYGVELSLPREERLEFERDVLYPMAGLDPARAAELAEIQALMEDLGNASNDAARRYLDGELTREQSLEWLQTYTLASAKRAEQNLRFFEAHRSYIVTYDVGEEMVKSYVERQATTREERWKVFSALLSSPTVPSDLR